MKAYIMPEWMEKYRPFFVNTGGNSIESLMDSYYNNKNLAVTNVVRFSLCVSVSSQIALLEYLKKNDLLK